MQLIQKEWDDNLHYEQAFRKFYRLQVLRNFNSIHYNHYC